MRSVVGLMIGAFLGFIILVSYGMWNVKYDMCRDAGHSKAACVFFASSR